MTAPAAIESNEAEAQPTPRDVQREALRDLLSLSQACVALEAELEERHKVELANIQGSFDRHTRDYEYRVEALRRQVEEKFVERQGQVEAQFGEERSKLKGAVSAKKAKIASDYDAVKNEVKKKFDQAVWLADSVLEASELQATMAVRKDAERHNEQSEQTTAAEAEAVRLVQTYGVTPIPADKPTIGLEATLASADTTLLEHRANADTQLNRLRSMPLARLFVGVRPWLLLFFITLCAAAYVFYKNQSLEPNWHDLGLYAGSAFGAAVVLGILLKVLALKQVNGVYAPLRDALANTRIASEAVHTNAKKARAEAVAQATTRREAEVKSARDLLEPVRSKAQHTRDTQMQSLESEYQRIAGTQDQKHARELAEAESLRKKQNDDLSQRLTDEQARLKAKFDSDHANLLAGFAQRRSELLKRWYEGLQRIQGPMGEKSPTTSAQTNWREAIGRDWVPPRQFPPTLAFGELLVDLAKISAGIPREAGFDLALPDHFTVPAMLAFPSQASLIIQSDPEGREEALRLLQMIMVKILTGIPAGRARFTIIDPVGLGQSFAGFMHLADHDDALVNGRIWTTPDQIESRLKDLAEHMETVIQKYLRNEYATIDDYNAQAGELAEPYRFLVIADFPSGFEGDIHRRLVSIARTGARCGVYTLILRDNRLELPGDLHIEDIESVSTNIKRENGKFVWKDEIFGQFPLKMDNPPDEETLTRIVNRVGEAAREAKRVEIDFDSIAPHPDEFWTGNAAEELSVPVGRSGATKRQYFRCGRGVAQHALVAGKTGSGKSTLLHAMVTNLAMWYSPDEVEFYLIDFKKGVEFKTYADYALQHARAIAVESDREFGLSVLQRIDAELTRRGELYRKAGTQDLASYRQTDGAQVMPRIMLIIDEFQEFFSEDDKLAQEAQLLLDRLVRQGRAFGIHVFLGSQTIGGSAGLARSTIGQMAIRIALQCNETDSQLILGDNNSAARLLSRPGEAIYNDAGGSVEHNSPFQVAWLPDSRREKYLQQVQNLLKTRGVKRLADPPIVFEGNQPADVSKNPRLNQLLANRPGVSVSAPIAWVGDPVAIKDPTGIIFRRQSGANALIIGQADEQALAVLGTCVIALAAQQPDARFVVMDGTPVDSSLAGELHRVVSVIPNELKHIEYRAVEEEINTLAEELAKRQADDQQKYPAIFLVINGLQRYRMLRKGEDEFSFGSSSDEPKKARPDKQFFELVREGPNVGIHVLAWCDTLANIERTFERGTMREFDNRVLFQMSSNDSSNIIDSPAANKLGFFRAIVYSEEQGIMEKFRPYGIPSKDWLEEVKGKLQTNAR